MNQRMAPKLSSQILDEATAWFVEFSEGDVSQQQRKNFITWLRTSPEHVRAYLQVTAHWEEARTLAGQHTQNIDDLIACFINMLCARPKAGKSRTLPTSPVSSSVRKRIPPPSSKSSNSSSRSGRGF